MTETRAIQFKAMLFSKVLAATPDNRVYLLAGLLATLYDAAPEHTKDALDAKVENFGVGLVRETK